MPDPLALAASDDFLTTYFQPVVALPSREVVGYEALSRWPRIDTPQVFAQARRRGCLDDLERICVEHAVTAARDAGLRPGAMLSINSEPTARYVDRRSSSILAEGAERYRVMFEITERDLFASPAGLLRKVRGMRADGFAIALDDVGAQRDWCGLLDVIQPDVIKLDLRLVQRNPTIDHARTLAAVLSYRERTGADVLAEGIENEEHLEQALALGAGLGQGYYFGRPDTVPQATTSVWQPRPTQSDSGDMPSTPFGLVERSDQVRVVRKEMLIAFSRGIERQVLSADDHQVVFASIQDRRFFTGRTRDTYLELAASSPMVALFGRGAAPIAGSALRAIDVADGDPLADEWLVIAIGGHSAAALLARARDDAADAQNDRRFDFVITQDRGVVARAARILMSRMA